MKKYQLRDNHVEAIQWKPGLVIDGRGLFTITDKILATVDQNGDFWVLEEGDWITIYQDAVSVLDEEAFRKHVYVN